MAAIARWLGFSSDWAGILGMGAGSFSLLALVFWVATQFTADSIPFRVFRGFHPKPERVEAARQGAYMAIISILKRKGAASGLRRWPRIWRARLQHKASG
jgi:hypothetical protein